MRDPKHPAKGPWISEFHAGERFVGFYFASDPQLEPFHDPARGHYLRVILLDRSGSIEGRIWEDAHETAVALGQGQAVKAEGLVEDFRGALQARIVRIRPASEDEFDAQDLLPSTRRKVEPMIAAIDDALRELEDPHLAALVSIFFGDARFRESFFRSPAASRIHHAYVGGLLEHTVEILHMSKSLLELYPEIDHALLTVGILLHDIGKLQELTGAYRIEYSDQGRLLGHVVMGYEMVSRAIEDIEGFPEHLALQVKHMLLAHHGRLEHGSPRRPKTMEALALHLLENLSAQVNRFQGLIEPTRRKGQGWTGFDRLLDRSLYAGSASDLSSEEQGLAE